MTPPLMASHLGSLYVTGRLSAFVACSALNHSITTEKGAQGSHKDAVAGGAGEVQGGGRGQAKGLVADHDGAVGDGEGVCADLPLNYPPLVGDGKRRLRRLHTQGQR